MKSLRWKEPRIFRQTALRENKRRARWFQPFATVFVAAIGIAGMAFHQKPIAGNWTVSVLAALGIGWLIVYGVPWIAALDPNIVFIGQRGIGRQLNRGGGVQHELWPWEKIAACRLESIPFEGRDYRVLAVYSFEDERAEFPLNDQMDSRELEQAILNNGGNLLRR